MDVQIGGFVKVLQVKDDMALVQDSAGFDSWELK